MTAQTKRKAELAALLLLSRMQHMYKRRLRKLFREDGPIFYSDDGIQRLADAMRVASMGVDFADLESRAVAYFLETGQPTDEAIAARMSPPMRVAYLFGSDPEALRDYAESIPLTDVVDVKIGPLGAVHTLGHIDKVGTLQGFVDDGPFVGLDNDIEVDLE